MATIEENIKKLEETESSLKIKQEELTKLSVQTEEQKKQLDSIGQERTRVLDDLTKLRKEKEEAGCCSPVWGGSGSDPACRTPSQFEDPGC